MCIITQITTNTQMNMADNNRTLILEDDENAVEVNIRKSSRAKRIIIKVSLSKGVELIIPSRVSYKNAISFLDKKQDWIFAQYKTIQNRDIVQFIEGSKIPVLGKMYEIRHSGNLRGTVALSDDKFIMVSGPKEFISRKVTDFLKKQAKIKITEQAHLQAKRLGKKFSKITVRDTETRWGSCSHNKNLSFSWRLILAPSYVLEYVVAHELAHLVEMNHSDKFWSIVDKLYPEQKKARKWLNEHGKTLHSYR